MGVGPYRDTVSDGGNVTHRIEATPNPRALKVVLPDLHVDGVLAVAPEQVTDGMPWVTRLMAIDGVDGVLAQTGAITVRFRSTPDEAAVRDALSGQNIMVVAPVHKEDQPSELDPEMAYRIEMILDWDIRPGLAAHGGNVTLVGRRERTLLLRWHGACSGCPSSAETLQLGIRARILRSFPDLEDVEMVP